MTKLFGKVLRECQTFEERRFAIEINNEKKNGNHKKNGLKNHLQTKFAGRPFYQKILDDLADDD